MNLICTYCQSPLQSFDMMSTTRNVKHYICQNIVNSRYHNLISIDNNLNQIIQYKIFSIDNNYLVHGRNAAKTLLAKILPTEKVILAVPFIPLNDLADGQALINKLINLIPFT